MESWIKIVSIQLPPAPQLRSHYLRRQLGTILPPFTPWKQKTFCGEGNLYTQMWRHLMALGPFGWRRLSRPGQIPWNRNTYQSVVYTPIRRNPWNKRTPHSLFHPTAYYDPLVLGSSQHGTNFKITTLHTLRSLLNKPTRLIPYHRY